MSISLCAVAVQKIYLNDGNGSNPEVQAIIALVLSPRSRSGQQQTFNTKRKYKLIATGYSMQTLWKRSLK